MGLRVDQFRERFLLRRLQKRGDVVMRRCDGLDPVQQDRLADTAKPEQNLGLTLSAPQDPQRRCFGFGDDGAAACQFGRLASGARGNGFLTVSKNYNDLTKVYLRHCGCKSVQVALHRKLCGSMSICIRTDPRGFGAS